MDSRMRGDSVSSQSTDGSNNPQLSSSGTTGTSSSSITTPGILASPEQNFNSPPLKTPELDMLSNFEEGEEGLPLQYPEQNNGLQGRRRPQAPLDINIRSISSHAQAEALVQAAQQSIFEMADQLPMQDDASRSAGLSPGWTPLSAKLAAYGESLAIKRRLEEEEERRGRDERQSTGADTKSPPRSPSPQCDGGKFRRHGINRQASLGLKPSGTVEREPRRPRTSGDGPLDELSSNRAQDTIPHTHRPSHSLSSQSSHITNETSLPRDHARANPRPALPPSHSFVEYADPLHLHAPDTELDVSSFENVADTSPPPHKAGQARDIASATKLTRMGFSATTTASLPRPPATTKPRFGGLKSLMQTIKGKP